MWLQAGTTEVSTGGRIRARRKLPLLAASWALALLATHVEADSKVRFHNPATSRLAGYRSMGGPEGVA